MTTASEFKMIPIGDIHESKHNPRRHFDGPALEQLADSIRKVGVLTPALVRPNAKGFELAAGHRRYRASQLAGLTQLPCLVREMDDQTFMEALTIENLQREDVHPLDEAKGYEALMAPPYKMDVQKIADRIGKSVKYVYDRKKLLDLTKDAQELFLSGHITAGHAIHLARLSPAEQAVVIGDPEDHYRNGGLFEGDHSLFTPHEEDSADEQALRSVKPVSVRELESYINQRVRFNAKQAEPILFPETVKTVKVAEEEREKIVPITHSYHVHPDAKDGTRTYGPMSWKRADGRQDSKTCEHAVTGVIVVGAGRGEAFKVCIDKKKCLVHWKAEAKALKQAAQSGGSQDGYMAKMRARQEKEEAERKAMEARWQKALPKILEATVDAVKKAPTKPTGPLAALLLRLINTRGIKKAVTHIPLGKTVDDFMRHAGLAMLIDEMEDFWQPWERFTKTAKVFGIDVAKIMDEAAPPAKPVAAEPAPKQKRPTKAAVQPSAPKAKKKKKAA